MDTKVLVGRWASFDERHPFASKLKRELTMKNPVYVKNKRMGYPTDDVDKTIKLFDEADGRVLIPRAHIQPYLDTLEVEDETVEGEAVNIQSNIVPRSHQKPFIDALHTALKGSYGVTGQAEAGFGKTVCALEIISRIRRKTVILVHKEFLRDQWIHRILGTEVAADFLGVSPKALSPDGKLHEPMLDVSPEDVGVIQQDRAEWENKKIVVGMVQSLTSEREYPREMYESFGLVVVDEVHRFAAPVFRQSIVKFPAAKRLGVTATPERNDGLEPIFFAHIGHIAAVGESARDNPRINQVETPVRVTSRIQRKVGQYAGKDKNGKPRFKENYAKMLNYLAEHEARNRLIVRLLLKAAKSGRKILVLSHRLQHLEDLRDGFLAETRRTELAASTAFYVGGMDIKERSHAAKMQVIFATYQMAEEGLDIPALDTAFLTTPIGNVEQAVGRILRIVEGKKTPVVVDFVDTGFGISSGLANKREREYAEQGWLN